MLGAFKSFSYMIRKHWSTLMFMQCLIRQTAFPISIINELEHQRQRSLGRFSPWGNHLDNVLSNYVRQQRCVTQPQHVSSSSFSQILHSLKPCWCLHSGETTFISSRQLFRFKSWSSVISPMSCVLWFVITVDGMLQTAMANVSVQWHAINTSCYHDTMSLHQHRLI